MTPAAKIVSDLLEEEDWKAYAMTSGDPSNELQAVLRDELVDRGFRRIQIHRGGDNPKTDRTVWTFSAEWINASERGEWMYRGARVPGMINPPEPRLVMRYFKAACRRAKINVLQAQVVEIAPTGHDIDLYAEYAEDKDFENQLGDYTVVIEFEAEWQPGFWSNASSATGYT